MQAREYKILFTGSMGAGKTTAINVISEIDPIQTDVGNTDLASHAKQTTTAALDYGQVTLSGGNVLRLYGTPGQARFDFMWEILGTGALGVVVLIDNTRQDPLTDLREYMLAFRETVQSSRAVVGIGRTHSHPQPTIDEFHTVLAELGLNVPILSVDVRRREDVLLLLDVLFNQIETTESMQAPELQKEACS
ncbi:MAG TPA: ATP/GTP-binding protein [Dokdonella sp.]|uniref:GTP-binding protein n=1 Tax=Dokdonella sp. TaxID=2291710 RepID=UPI002D80CC58|nr:ATP/GTP-binding protein [Dokdonella sp.]HET9033569.1 ATP/GTP-binding protein [Dokdonella sp.]